MRREQVKEKVHELYPNDLIQERTLGAIVVFDIGTIKYEEKFNDPSQTFTKVYYPQSNNPSYTCDTFTEAVENAESTLHDKLIIDKKNYIKQLKQKNNTAIIYKEIDKITKTLLQLNHRHET